MSEERAKIGELKEKVMSRREVIRAIGMGAAVALPVAHLLAACGDDTGESAMDMGGTAAEEMGVDLAQDMGGEQADQSVPSGAWATGGTAAMVAVASYPDPFATASGSSCTLTCGATIGPCHTTSPERADVSDGWDGIPVRLALRVVDESCQPVEDVIVEIWHTNYKGIYSGQINAMCNKDEADRVAGYFRGYQRTDADGVVRFDTCYPGWYSGRVVHIHFRVISGGYDASDSARAEVVSQLFFPDALNASIFGDQSLYEDYGQPDTQLGTDNVVGGESDPSNYVLDVERMSDGAMLASKTIVLRSTSGSACALQGSGGGGMPPGGMMGG